VINLCARITEPWRYADYCPDSDANGDDDARGDGDALAEDPDGGDDTFVDAGPPCGNAYGPGDADAGLEHVTLDLAGYRTGSVSPADDKRETVGTGAPSDLDADYPTRGR
jgi:hypothetical protein